MRFIILACFSIILAAASHSRADSADLGITYTVPDGFIIQDRNPPPTGWKEIYMVQEKKGNANQKHSPELSICSFDEKTTARMLGVADQMQGTYKTQIGSHSVIVLPGFPGPYGEDAFFYIVPRGDGTSIGITAPRFLSKPGISSNDRHSSGMETVIETLVATMAF